MWMGIALGEFVSFRSHVCMLHWCSLYQGCKISLCRRATPVIWGWITGCMSQLAISRISISLNFCVILILKCMIYSSFGKSLCTYKRCWKWFPRTIVSKNWIKQLHTLPVLHFNRCLTTEYSETTAHFNSNHATDNQIYVPWSKCTATFRTRSRPNIRT
jgi:hypothetical protein